MKDTEQMIEIEKIIESQNIPLKQKISLKRILGNSVYGLLKHLEKDKNERY